MAARLGLALQIGVTVAASILAIRVAGGPTQALVVQGGAAVLGLALMYAIIRLAQPPGRRTALAILVLALAVEAWVLVAGVSVEGVRRWIRLGPLLLHPASLLAPLTVWAAARRLDATAAILILALLAILAAQPDAAAVLALTLGLMTLAVCATDHRRWAAGLALVGALCAAWAFSRHDPLPAVDHVELVVRRALDASPAVGGLAATALVVLPLAFLWRDRSPSGLALVGAWAGFVTANLIANYPAPVVGAGASPVVGWLLSLGLTFISARDRYEVQS